MRCPAPPSRPAPWASRRGWGTRDWPLSPPRRRRAQRVTSGPARVISATGVGLDRPARLPWAPLARSWPPPLRSRPAGPVLGTGEKPSPKGRPPRVVPRREALVMSPAEAGAGGAVRENRLVPNGPLQGMTIGVTAERRATEQAELFQKRGARVLLGPALRVFSYEQDEVLKASTADVVDRPPDFLLASTGFGMRTWLAAAESWGMREALVGALGQARVANRGAKAASANTAAGLTEWWRAPHERLDELIGRVSSRAAGRPAGGAPAPRRRRPRRGRPAHWRRGRGHPGRCLPAQLARRSHPRPGPHQGGVRRPAGSRHLRDRARHPQPVRVGTRDWAYSELRGHSTTGWSRRASALCAPRGRSKKACSIRSCPPGLGSCP